MKLLLPFLFLLSFNSFTQTKNFRLSDTTFYAGQEIDLPIRFFPDQRMLIDSTTVDLMDSIKAFVLNHPSFVFEIQCNTDYRGDSLYNLRFTEQRALGIKAWLQNIGANPENIKTNSQGERKPFLLTNENPVYLLLPRELQTKESYLLTEKFVVQFKADRKLFEQLNQLNRRTVFRIIST